MGARWGRGERVSGRPCSPILFSRTVPPPPSQPNWLFSLGAGVRLHSHHGEAGWVSPGGREPFPATLLPSVQPPPRGCRSPGGEQCGQAPGVAPPELSGPVSDTPGSPAGRGRSLGLETTMPSGRQLCQQPCCVALSPLRKKNANPLPGTARASGTHRGQAGGGGAPAGPSPPSRISGHLKLSSSKTRRHLPEPAPRPLGKALAAHCSRRCHLSLSPESTAQPLHSDMPGPAVPAAQRHPPSTRTVSVAPHRP